MKNPNFHLKSFFAILIFFSFQHILFSQNTFTVGIKGGMISNRFFSLTGNSGNTSTFYSGSMQRLSVGISSELFKSKRFMLMTELFYLERGAQFEGVSNSYYTVTPYAGLISFAALPAFRYENKYISPYIFGGPRLEFFMLYRLTVPPGKFYQASSVLFGYSLGAGAEKQISKKIAITFDARYSRDISRSVEGITVGYSQYYYRNESFDFLLGVNYTLGGAK